MNRYRYNSSSNCNQKKDFKKPEGSYQDNYQWSNSNQSNYQSQSNSNWFQQSSRRQSYNQQTFSYFNTSSAELYRDRDYPTSSSGDFVEQGYQVFNSFPTPPSIQNPSTNNFRTYNVKQNKLYNCEQSHDSNSYSTELIPRRQLKRAFDPQSPVRMSKMPRNNIQSQETGITNHNLVVCGGESSTSRPAEQQRQPYQKNQRITRNRPSRQKPANKPANFNNNWHDAIEYVMKKLKMRASNNVEDCFESEVNLLTCCLQNSAQQSQATKSEVDNDLRNLVRPLGVKNVLAFGSKLTGLEFLQSDIDYHVELEQPPKSNEEAKPIIDMVGSLTRASKSGQRPPFFVKCSILGARVPLIRLVHRRHMITCDVNFTSKNGYYNSQYIKQVLSFDTRIKDVAIILKLWSKINHLNEKMVMSSYCLVNLLFFFLQNLITPMLGNLKDVQKDKIDDESNSNWNFYYDDTMNKCQDNTQSTRELVEEFFEFYNKINFVNYVICLYSGQLVRRDEFDENEDLDHYRNTIAEHRMPPFKLKEEDSIMVQDPFEQNINIGIKGKKRIEIFTACMADAYRKCKEFKHENFSKLLFELFTEHVIVEKKPAKMEKKDKKLFQLTVHSTAGDLKVNFAFSIVNHINL